MGGGGPRGGAGPYPRLAAFRVVSSTSKKAAGLHTCSYVGLRTTVIVGSLARGWDPDWRLDSILWGGVQASIAMALPVHVLN